MNWPQMCAGICQGSIHFGTQSGHQCWCGPNGEDAEYDKYWVMNRCNQECPGNETEMCGGAWSMSTYEFDELAIEGEILRVMGYGYH